MIFFVPFFWRLLLGVAIIGTLASTVFLGLVLIAARRFARLARKTKHDAESIARASFPPISLLKPVHGLEPRMEENL